MQEKIIWFYVSTQNHKKSQEDGGDSGVVVLCLG